MQRMIQDQQPTSYFYDLNAKLTYNITQKDILSYSFFSGQDYFDNSHNMDHSRGGISVSGGITDYTKWGNWGSSIKWSRKWNEKLYTNNLISFSDYKDSKDRSDSRTIIKEDGTSSEFNNGSTEDNNLKDFCMKTDNEWKWNDHNQIEFGAQYNHYKINYNFVQNDTLTILNMLNNADLLAVYIQNRLNPYDKRSPLYLGSGYPIIVILVSPM